MEKIKKGEIAKAVLGCIGALGIVAVGVTCPGLFYLIPNEYRRRYSKKSFDQAFERLKGKDYLAVRRMNGKWNFHLTSRGERHLQGIELGSTTIPKPKHWDGKWRVLIFDIPEKDRNKRDGIRHYLRQLDFYPLQQSVWVHPYDCRHVVDLLRIKHRVLREALYLVVEKLDGDRWLRHQFFNNSRP